LFPLLALGFFLGVRHATDADHVVAVTTIVSRERSPWLAALIGCLWGVGHTMTIVAVGGAIILLGLVIPPRLGLTMEFSVAVMLIILGVLNLTGILRWLGTGPGIGRRGRAAGDTGQARLDRTFGRLGLYQVARPLVVGVIHGLAGSAAVALLVLATIREPIWALAYLMIFGLGTIAGMMVITLAIAAPFAYTAARFARLNRYLGVASGLLSLGFGLFLVYQIGFVDGLFSANPRWTPD
jgi:high-affinity nickel-transport protein